MKLTGYNKILIVAIAFSIIVLTGGCCTRYSFTGQPMPGINSIAIPIFVDMTTEYGLREKVTSTVIDKFIEDNAHIVPSHQ